MKHVKTSYGIKRKIDCLVTYIKKEIDIGISTNAIIDGFDQAPRRVDFN